MERRGLENDSDSPQEQHPQSGSDSAEPGFGNRSASAPVAAERYPVSSQRGADIAQSQPRQFPGPVPHQHRGVIGREPNAVTRRSTGADEMDEGRGLHHASEPAVSGNGTDAYHRSSQNGSVGDGRLFVRPPSAQGGAPASSTGQSTGSRPTTSAHAANGSGKSNSAPRTGWERTLRAIRKGMRRIRFDHRGNRVRTAAVIAALLVLHAISSALTGSLSTSSADANSGVADPKSQSEGLTDELFRMEAQRFTPEQLAFREEYVSQPLSILVLFHNEYDTLIPVLDSWIEGGLVDYADEILFFLNDARSTTSFYRKVPAVKDRMPASKVRVFAQHPNLRIGLAIKKMVELASHEYVLLLEKDWKLVEPRLTMQSRLRDSKVLVGSGTATLVRHRHRDNPGVPIHALIMHDGREELMMANQPNLMCFVHHWQKDPTIVYPGADKMWRCGGVRHNIVEEDMFCSKAKYCQWTNNPAVFRKSWFHDLGELFARDYETEIKTEGKNSPFLDFEYYTNWRSYAWNDKNYTVAVGAGLFSHLEVEHKHFNTFWYAHFRLTSDLEDIRNNYLRNESAFKQLGGVHYDPDFGPPLSVPQRYPVEFVRKYQVPEVFAGTLDDQNKSIATIYNDYVSKYRVFDEAKANKDQFEAVPWRRIITDLHFATEKSMMLVPPIMPHEMTITLVTSLFDIDRHTVDRGFQMYIDAMLEWLSHRYKKVVYTTPELAAKLTSLASDEALQSTRFIHTSRDELRTRWLGPDNYVRVQKIRTDPKWRSQAQWLANSPQANLSDYNPLVMSKLFMLRDVARNNPWNTTHFVYLDAKHNCRAPAKLTPRSDHILRAHMLDKFLLTDFDYVPSTEVHGFEYVQFNEWTNTQPASKRNVVRVGRGGIFGASAFVLEAITAMYDVALTASLRQGVMGTEENIFSILLAQVPQYVDTFSNTWACKLAVRGDHKCKLANPNGNCAIFTWATEDAPSNAAA